MLTTPLDAARTARAKSAYTTRHVRPESFGTLLTDVTPAAGDLVLARVIEIGQHQRIERPDGRRAALFPGDEIIVCYGNRYAPDQFEAEVPRDLGPCHLAAAGGVAGRVLSWHAAMEEPTTLEPIGLLGDGDGQWLNLRDWALPDPRQTVLRPPTIAVVGTAMNAGKTTTAAAFTRGLVEAGLVVGAAKVTGTGAGGDLWLYTDSGATPALDFRSRVHV